jgi:hypothetical protein
LISAVDASVLIDFFAPDSAYGPRAKEVIARHRAEGTLVACEIVWAEVMGTFADPEQAAQALDGIGVSFDPIRLDAASTAGRVWREYRRRGGKRERIVADFLVGAHALLQADQLVTRDRGFYRTYFASLNVVDPSAD